jgi:hypothetical protein
MLDGLCRKPAGKSKAKSDKRQAKQIREVEKELYRKDNALAEIEGSTNKLTED